MTPTRSHIVLYPREVVRVASAIALFLLFANVCGLFMTHIVGHPYVYGLVPLFDFNTEQNLPSFLSGCLFLISALLLLIICRAESTTFMSQMIWFFLAGLFLFLAFDELFEVHERLIRPIRKGFNLSRFLFFAWAVAYGVGVLLLSLVFFPVWWRLQRGVRLWLGLSAATYLAGAIGMEMLGGKYYEGTGKKADLVFGVLYTTEESLEIAGLIMFIYSLLLLLQNECDGCAIVISGGQNTSSPSNPYEDRGTIPWKDRGAIPWKAPSCQETNKPLKRTFIFFSACRRLVQSVRGVVS